jgi:toxic protein SymE
MGVFMSKKVRQLKVYGNSGKWCKEPPEIRLKGKWLQDLGFECGDNIEVKCASGKLIIRVTE